MKFKFKTQKYQTDAVESIIKVFEGQAKYNLDTHGHDFGKFKADSQARFIIDGSSLNPTRFEKQSELAYSNHSIDLTDTELLENIQNIQKHSDIILSRELDKSLGRVSLDIEMETGTGKTYVYTKAMYELNKHYGWSKFIIVVPSIAIREGVKKSLEQTTEHFMSIYGKKIRFFIYDSSNLQEIDDYDQSNDIYVMIINHQAFALDFDEEKAKEAEKKLKEGKKVAKKIIFEKRDEFGSRAPIDVIKENRPIIILDEPQKLSGKTTQKALKSQFNALFSMNFSATHKNEHNLVYVLDALDAYNQKLVKRIEVKGFELERVGGTGCYVYFEEIVLDKKLPPRARIEIEVNRNSGTPREFRLLEEGESLYRASGDLAEYKDVLIERIDVSNNTITLTGNIVLRAGEPYGDVPEKELRRLQIRETILSHMDKEQHLFHKGIKCLSLFFIDHVDNYRIYDGDTPVLGEYGVMFEKEFNRILAEQSDFFDPEYIKFLKKFDVSKIHEGYFSIDRKTKRDVESSTRKEGDAELAAYEKILRRKDILLDMDEPIRFIFSHSALREGWDNPNIFQICALKHSESGPDANRAKRQEVGRGLRLCLNQNGDRMDFETIGDAVHDINLLTVIASEGYSKFVEGLQDATKEDLRDRPLILNKTFLTNRTLVREDGSETSITEDQAAKLYKYLLIYNLIDEKTDQINPMFSASIIKGNIPQMPEELQPIETELKKLLATVAAGGNIKALTTNARAPKYKDNEVNDNFYKAEFQALWKEISNRYAYYVDFESPILILDACKRIEDELTVSKLKYTKKVGKQDAELTRDKMESGQGFISDKRTETKELSGVEYNDVKYDLVGEIAKRCSLTRRTVVEILKNISEKKFNYFKDNPEEFIRKVSEKINDSKASVVVEHIEYHKTDEKPYDATIFTESKLSAAYDHALTGLKKHVTDYLFTDGTAEESVEKRFARELDEQNAVSYYAKLPKGFSIPTPVGNYSPDWAIAFNESSGVRHIYFVAETKGNSGAAQLREVEHAKTQCAKKLFNEQKLNKARYEVVKDYKELLNKINDIE